MNAITILATGLALCAQEPERFRIVVDYDGTMSASVWNSLLGAKDEDLDRLTKAHKLAKSNIEGVLFLHSERTPYQEHADNAKKLITGLSLGMLQNTEALDPETRRLLEGKVLEKFGAMESGGLPQSFVMRAVPKFRLNVGGKRVDMDLVLEDGSNRGVQTQQLLANASVRRPSDSNSTAVAHDGTITFHANKTRHTAETLRACAEFLNIIAEQNEKAKEELEAAVKPVLDRLNQAALPTGDESLEQLPIWVRDRLKGQFIASFRVNGFASEDEAERAWSSATMIGGGVKFTLDYAVQDARGSKTLRSVEITRTGRWD